MKDMKQYSCSILLYDFQIIITRPRNLGILMWTGNKELKLWPKIRIIIIIIIFACFLPCLNECKFVLMQSPLFMGLKA